METESFQKGAQWLETLGYVQDKQDWKPLLGWSPKRPRYDVTVWYCPEKDSWSADEFLTYEYLRGHDTAELWSHSWYATPQEALEARMQVQLVKQTECAEIATQEIARLENNLREVTGAAPLSEEEWLRKSLREAITRQDVLRKALREAGIPDPTLKFSEESKG